MHLVPFWMLFRNNRTKCHSERWRKRSNKWTTNGVASLSVTQHSFCLIEKKVSRKRIWTGFRCLSINFLLIKLAERNVIWSIARTKISVSLHLSSSLSPSNRRLPLIERDFRPINCEPPIIPKGFRYDTISRMVKVFGGGKEWRMNIERALTTKSKIIILSLYQEGCRCKQCAWNKLRHFVCMRVDLSRFVMCVSNLTVMRCR